MRRTAQRMRLPLRARDRRPARSPRVSTRWILLVLAALLSFTGQNVVTQTHVHFEGLSTAVTPAAARPAAHRRAPSSPASCPICHEAAQTAFYLIADPVALALPIALAFWMMVPAGASWPGRRRSHAWHSRGPPGALFA
jgi:hypothetical protein